MRASLDIGHLDFGCLDVECLDGRCLDVECLAGRCLDVECLDAECLDVECLVVFAMIFVSVSLVCAVCFHSDQTMRGML